MAKNSAEAAALWPFLLPRIERMLDAAAAGEAGGGGTTSGAPSPHGLDSGHHSGTLADSQAPQFLLLDGTRTLTGNLAVSSGITIDGVDLSAHVADADAHHARVTAGNGIAVSGQAVSVDLATNPGLEFSGGDLRIDLVSNSGLELSASGLGIDLDSNPGLQLGAGGLSMGTPASVTASSTNSVTTNTHTHAADSSSNPGANAKLIESTALGGVTLETFDSNGYIKAAQDLWGGAGMFKVIHHTDGGDHVHVVVNPTVSWSLDEQFGVDIDDNLLVRGFIVGRHALQIKGAKLIAHWDGYEPYETDLTGETMGHMGQVATSTTKPNFRPGVFGKALQISAATTNQTPNPSFETGTTGWANSVVTLAQSASVAYVGTYSLRVTAGASAGYAQQNTGVVVANGSSVTVQAMCYQTAGSSGRLRLVDSGGATLGTTDATLTDEWELLVVAWTNSTGSSVTVHPRLFNLKTDSSTNVYYDAVQVDAGIRAAPYFDGTFAGATWSGTAHASTSVQAAATDLRYTAGNVPTNKGTIGLWVRYPWGVEAASVGSGYLFSTGTNTGISLRKFTTGNRLMTWRIGNTTEHDAASALPADREWHYIALTWDIPNGRSALYVDGALHTADLLGGMAVPVHSQFYVGSNGVDTTPFPGWYDDLLIVGRELTADEIRAIYDSDAPVFGETSTFHFRAGKNLVWADTDGLWMIDADGNTVMGMSGVDSQSWGGVTLNKGDILFGHYGSSKGGWLAWDRDGVASLGYLSIGYKDVTVFALDDGGATINGVLDISTSGGIYQGTGSFASPTTGLKVSNSGGVGRIQGYNGGTLQWVADTDGRLKAGAGNVILDAAGIRLAAPVVGDFGFEKSVSWRDASGDTIGAIYTIDGTTPNMTVQVSNDAASAASSLVLEATDVSGLVVGVRSSLSIDQDGSTPTAEFSADHVTIAHQSATGDPYLAFSQVATRRSFIQHIDAGDILKIASEYGSIALMPGSGGTEVQIVSITPSFVNLSADLNMQDNDILFDNNQGLDWSSGDVVIKETATNNLHMAAKGRVRIYSDKDASGGEGIQFYVGSAIDTTTGSILAIASNEVNVMKQVQLEGDGTITSAPETAASNLGWKQGFYSDTWALGMATGTLGIRMGDEGWFALFNNQSPANSGSSATAMDSNAFFGVNVNRLKYQGGVLGEGWTALSYAGVFGTFAGGHAAAYKRFGDIVYLRGKVSTSSGSGNTATIGTLPSGYRPSSTQRIPVVTDVGSGSYGFGHIEIQTDGDLVLQGDATGFVSLDGVNFSTA